MARKAKDGFGYRWIREMSQAITPRYENGVLTIRALYYQLVSLGMTNSFNHYKRVVDATGKMRRKGELAYYTFSDHDRKVLGHTDAQPTDVNEKISSAKSSIVETMETYNKSRWENQPRYVEVWIEKKAQQGVFEKPCNELGVALCPCKGYPSLTFLFESAYRFAGAIERGQDPIILYFGDYDATGVNIPKKIAASFREDFGLNIEVKPVLLNKAQVLRWKLPIAPSKKTDSRTKNFEANGGLGQVEMDAVEPHKMRRICKYAINKQFDKKLHKELLEQQKEEKEIYIQELKDYVKTL